MSSSQDQLLKLILRCGFSHISLVAFKAWNKPWRRKLNIAGVLDFTSLKRQVFYDFMIFTKVLPNDISSWYRKRPLAWNWLTEQEY